MPRSSDGDAVHGRELESVERRRWLAIAITCLSGAALPATLTALVTPDSGSARLDQLLPNVDAAVAVGRQYLRQHPQEASAAWLAAQLFGERSLQQSSVVQRERWLAMIDSGRQRDFCDGDLVVLDGWFLARTEARLLGLIALRAS